MLKQVHSCTFHHLVCVSVSKSDLLFSMLKNIQNGHVKESTEQYHLYLNFFSMMMMMLVRFPFPIFVPSSTISSFFTKNYMSYVTLHLLFIYFLLWNQYSSFQGTMQACPTPPFQLCFSSSQEWIKWMQRKKLNYCIHEFQSSLSLLVCEFTTPSLLSSSTAISPDSVLILLDTI